MKRIFAIIWKDLIVRFATPWEWMFFIILPLIFSFLLAGGAPSGEGDNRIRLLVVDEAQSDISRQLVATLEDSTAVRIETTTREAARGLFDEREASSVLFIPAGLDLQALQAGKAEIELLQQPKHINASIAERAVYTAMRSVGGTVDAARSAVEAREKLKPFASAEEEQIFFTRSLALARTLREDAPARVKVNMGSTQDQVFYDPLINSSAGQLITWVFIPLIGISAMFAAERQQGTLRRLLTTPTRKATFLLGTIGGQVLIALIQMTLLLSFGVLVMKMNWGREPLALFVLLTCGALAAAAFGTTLGTFVKTEGQANGLSIMFGMVFGMMGGCWYPLELFPPAVQSAVKILPTTWTMQGMLTIGLRGGGLVDILPNALVLVGFAAVFFTVGVLRFRYE